MGIIGPDPKTTMTGGHMQLFELLSDLGYIVQDEVEFGIYTVDCYIFALHMAFEFDGPQHMAKHDKDRDYLLRLEFALPVIRVDDRKRMLEQICAGLMETWRSTSQDRRNYSYKG